MSATTTQAPFAPFEKWVWQVPSHFNIGVACTDIHLGTSVESSIAMIVEDDTLGTSEITFAGLSKRTHQFAQLLRNIGIASGERVLILSLIHISEPTRPY